MYPLVVVAVIVVSASQLSVIHKLLDRQRQVETEEEKLARLREKLAKLEAVDLQAEVANLQFLATAVPTTKQVWVVASELKVAAAEAGVLLEGYKGSGDLIVEATFGVAGIDQLGQLVATLERKLPLVKVVDVKYAFGKATVTVSGVWLPLADVTGLSEQPVPETAKDVSDVQQQLAGFVGLAGGSVPIAGVEVNPVPFQPE